MENNQGSLDYPLQPLDSFTFGQKEQQNDDDSSVVARLQRLGEEYRTIGMRRSVEAVCLVEKHGFPHVLCLQMGSTGSFVKLPGDQLNAGEDAVEGLIRILNHRLSPSGVTIEWKVRDLMGVWWRPNIDVPLYPYKLPHIEHPKEQKQIFLVELPPNTIFAVPRNYRLVAIPLFELYENQQRYGSMLASLPHLVSRYTMNLIVNKK